MSRTRLLVTAGVPLDSGFTLKAGETFGIVREQVREDFQGHIPAELRVPGAVDLTHAARADERDDLILAEPRTGGDGHRGKAGLYRQVRVGCPTGCLPGSGGSAYCNVKVTVTVMTTATGTPFSKVGVYSHCLTAAIAASSRGTERYDNDRTDRHDMDRDRGRNRVS